MKTIKWLKTSIVLQSIFAFFCITSSLCFAINRYFDLSIFFTLGNTLVYGWLINPIGLISVVVGLILFFSEKSNNENRKIIGKKWILFIVFFVIDILLYFTAGVLLAAFTGGV
ncbi:MAG: hypothetical protein IJ433_04045 [Ruminococcus sp.]|nr:hypothetical protein [Ruminococcus sp.]